MRGSGTTSASAAPKAPAPHSESAFLQQQADHAKAALAEALGALKHDLAHGGDPRAWVRSHPWATLAATAVAGFAATSVAVPSKEQQAIARLRALERAIHGENGGSRQSSPAGDNKPAETLGTVVTREVIGMVRPIVLTLLTNLLSGNQPAPATGPSGDPSADPATMGQQV